MTPAKYLQSDFVALVTISETFPNHGAALHYKSNIVIHELFKGKSVRSILVEGSSDGKRRTCDIFFKKGTKMLVYAQETNKGQYIFNFCSGYVVLSNAETSGEKRELEMLNFLKHNGIKTNDKSWFGVDLGKKLDAFQGETLTKSFAIFEITFGGNLKIDSVSTIVGFSPDVDQKLIAVLKQSRWFSSPQDTKFLFAFYYYPAQEKYRSFISEYDF
jgi:hypothetical protein